MSMGLDGGKKPFSEINVTPFVDVMLVLLVIFMVTAPLMQQGLAVKLPQVQADALPKDQEALVLTLTHEGRAFLGDTEVPAGRLQEVLANNARLQKEKIIYLHADESLRYGRIIEVMAAAKSAGADEIGMVTDPLVPDDHKQESR